MDLGLAGKTVIIAGDGSKSGRGITLGFAQESFNVEAMGKKTLDEFKQIDVLANWKAKA